MMNIYEKMNHIDSILNSNEYNSTALIDYLKDESLRLYFLSMTKDPKWLPVLEKNDYLNIKKNPKPIHNEGGGISAEQWDIFYYLNQVENIDKQHFKTIHKLLQNLTAQATKLKKSERANFNTLSSAFKLLANMPFSFYEDFDWDQCKIWTEHADGLYSTTIIIDEIIPKILNSNSSNASIILCKIFEILFHEKKDSGKDRPEITSRAHWIDELIKKSSKAPQLYLIGGEQLFKTLESIYRYFDKEFNIDESCNAWKPAIEEHSQNIINDRVDALLARLIRDSSLHLADTNNVIIEELLKSELILLQRTGLYISSTQTPTPLNQLSIIIDNDLITPYQLRHEAYTWLKSSFDSIDETFQSKILSLITNIENDGDHKYYSYRVLNFLKAIENSNNSYVQELLTKHKSDGLSPSEHPEFTSYISSWSGTRKPKEADNFVTLPINKQLELLKEYEDKKDRKFGEPYIEGMAQVLKDSIKAQPSIFFKNQDKFIHVHKYYQNYIFDALKDVWNESPKSYNWPITLKYIKHFLNSRAKEYTAEDHYGVFKAISRLLDASTKDDKTAAPLELNEQILEILISMKEYCPSDVSYESEDLYTSAINSPLGCLIESFILYGLRKARKLNKESAWNDIVEHFEEWISNKVVEVFIILPSFIPNLLYINPKWTRQNLERLFPINDNNLLRASLEGYAYTRHNYKEIYENLKKIGVLDKIVKEKLFTNKQFIKHYSQLTASSYIAGYEDLSYLKQKILKDDNTEEIIDVIHYFWGFRRKEVDNDRYESLLNFWEELHRYIKTISDKNLQITLFKESAVLIDALKKLGERELNIIKDLAPYALRQGGNSLITERLHEFSKAEPKRVGQVYLWVLKSEYNDRLFYHPKDKVKDTVRNIYKSDKLLGDEICIIYAQRKSFDFLREIYWENQKG